MFEISNAQKAKKLEKQELNQLVAQYQSGDENAFNTLYYATYDVIWSISRSFFPCDKELCEDCLQDIYLNLYQKSMQYDASKGDFLPWFKKTAENICKTYYQKQKKSHQQEFFTPFDNSKEDGVTFEYEETKFYFNPDAFVDRNENTKLIDAIIEQLPEQQRECLLLYLTDCKQERIAELLGIPIGTVKSRIYNGKKFIEEKVRELEKQGTKLYGMPPFVFFAWAFAQEGDTKTINDAFSNLLLVKKAAAHSEKNMAGMLFSKMQQAFVASSATTKLLIAISGTAIIGTGTYYAISRANPELPQLPKLPVAQNVSWFDSPDEPDEPQLPRDTRTNEENEDNEDTENNGNTENNTTPVSTEPNADMPNAENVPNAPNTPNTPNTPNAATPGTDNPAPSVPTEPPANNIISIRQSHSYLSAPNGSIRLDLQLAPGHAMPFGPDELSWSTDADPSFLTVDQSGWVHVGTKVPSKNYTATVTARAGSYEAHCKVTIVVESITTNLDGMGPTMFVGETYRCTASTGAQWSSNNPSIASITPDGLLKAHGTGTVTLTAKYPDIYRSDKTYRLSVFKPDLYSVYIPDLYVGSSEGIWPSVAPTNGWLCMDKLSSLEFSFQSSNPDVASFATPTAKYLDGNTLTAHKSGTTEIIIRPLFSADHPEYRKTIVIP